MNVARFFVAVLILLGAALAACSGSFGSGTTPPNGLLPSGNLAGISPTPTPTPNSASNIVTYGSNAEFQPLPSAAGYGGAIAFPVPSPKPSGFSDVAIGATLSLVKPDSAPDLNLAGKKGKKGGRKRERPARALAYLTLLPTHDVTLAAYPRIAIDVPRDIVTVYRESELGIALYNAGAKDSTFRLAVAELDTATPPPMPTANPSAPAAPTAIPVSASPSPSPTASGAGASPTLRPSGAPSGPASPAAPTASPTLPPQRVLFAGTATELKMYANQPIVFALYALPVATPSPNPLASASSAAAEPSSGGSPEAAGSPVASGSPLTAAPSPAGS